MKKCLYMIGLLAVFLLLTGMSGLGGTPANRVPTPEKDFSATFTDKQTVVTVCSQVSRQGETFFMGKRGEGTVTVSFEKVQTAEFKNRGDKVTAVIKLTTGKTVEIEVDKGQTFYGNVDFGTFKIEAADLKRITFGD